MHTDPGPKRIAWAVVALALACLPAFSACDEPPRPPLPEILRADLRAQKVDSPHPTYFWADMQGRLRIDNAGPYTPREARRIARWILESFRGR